MLLHPDAITEQGPTGQGTRRIDDDHPWTISIAAVVADQLVDEGLLPAPGGPVIPITCGLGL